MPLLLPFFKFYVHDWLQSEKIALMDAAQIGTYIMLLAKCWAHEHCTLPHQPQLLKSMIKWQGSDAAFLPVLSCFKPVKRGSDRLTNPRLYAEWTEARARTEVLSESGQRGAAKRWSRKAPRVKPTKVSPVDWLTTFQALPLYAHVNWPHEHAKMDVWIADHPGRVKNKEFVRQWVNKIDPPLPNGAGTRLTCPHHPQLTFPDAKAKKAHDFDHHPKFEG